jgi:2-polyprenyl-6-methoxyphenol hydroxylase-like FAD-dependent oxidoreductase
VLEKWPDFFRDFRGDTIHPSTLQNLHELGLLEKFLQLPHEKTYEMVGSISGTPVSFADFRYLSVRSPFIAFIPQWDFLNFIVAEAKKYPHFHLLMDTAATGLIEKDGKVVGLTGVQGEKTFEISAALTVGADGRHSTLREKSGLPLTEFGVPIDVLWYRISRIDSDPTQSLARIDSGRVMVMIQRGSYWQCGFVIGKGGYDKIKTVGLAEFHASILLLAPFLMERASEITDWEQVKLLSVTVDRLDTWYKDGLICIGDAAHAMSPIGGVGINFAIQDAVASANILVPAFKKGSVTINELEFPVKVMQWVQVAAQKRVFAPILAKNTGKPITLPWPLKLIRVFPFLRYFPARFIGIGVRPEHIQTKESL